MRPALPSPPFGPNKTRHPLRRAMQGILVALGLTVMGGCTGPLVQSPTVVRPMTPPPYVERVATGSLYQAGASSWLFQDEKRPSNIGDTVKIDIAEQQSARNKVNSEARRANSVAVKGPGGGGQSGFVRSLLNADASASGSDTFKGDGTTEQSSAFTGRLAAQVINVLPNGHLVVAGEKNIVFNGNASTLRFSGIVNPKDIQLGGVVSSRDIVDARMEQVGQGDVTAASSRTWIQRVLTNALTIW